MLILIPVFFLFCFLLFCFLVESKILNFFTYILRYVVIERSAKRVQDENKGTLIIHLRVCFVVVWLTTGKVNKRCTRNKMHTNYNVCIYRVSCTVCLKKVISALIVKYFYACFRKFNFVLYNFLYV